MYRCSEVYKELSEGTILQEDKLTKDPPDPNVTTKRNKGHQIDAES